MYQRQSNNQWSSGMVRHLAPPQIIPSEIIPWKSFRLDFVNQDVIHLIGYIPNDLMINAEYFSFRLVQLTDIL
jgi:hypothetical protein